MLENDGAIPRSKNSAPPLSKVELRNHLLPCSPHSYFVDDTGVSVSPVNRLFSEVKVEQNRASHPGHKPPLVLPIKIHPMNGFTMAKDQEGLCSLIASHQNYFFKICVSNFFFNVCNHISVLIFLYSI